MTRFARPLVSASFCLVAVLTLAGQPGQAPEKLTFSAKNGAVTFGHAAHVKRLAGDCKACHTKLFAESKTEPLNYKAGMHKTAEAAHTSCGGCHFSGGTAFETKGNCAKCHVKP